MPQQSQSQNSFSIGNAWQQLKKYIQNQLRLKKILRRALLLQFQTKNSTSKIGLINSFLACGCLILNVTIYGFWRFSHKQYRNLKGILSFQILYGYLLGSYFLVWQDYLFLNKICKSQNDLAYYYRKQCIKQVGQLKKVAKFKQKFQKLNLQYTKFNSVIINNQKINFAQQI